MFNQRTGRGRHAAVIAWAVLACCAGAARADLKLVSTLDVTGMPQVSPDLPPGQYRQTLTTFIKGTVVAVSVDGGMTTVYDRAANKVTTFDPATQTYSVETWDQRLQRGGPSRRAMSRLDMAAKIDAEQGETKAVLGRDSKREILSGWMTMSPRLVGGGKPGGSSVLQGDPSFSGADFPSLELEGEVWLAGAIELPWDKKDKDAPLALAAEMLPDSPLTKPLAERLAQFHALPLSSTVRLTVLSSTDETVPLRITSTLTVISITEAPLDDAVFQAPAGYKPGSPAPAYTLFPMPGGPDDKDSGKDKGKGSGHKHPARG